MKNQNSNETHRELSKRVKQASTKQQLTSLDIKTTRFYNSGLLTAAELRRLDGMIMDRLAKFD